MDALAREAQFMHAARVVAVPVEVASHTPRLAKASMKFREILSQVAVTFPPTGSTRLLNSAVASSIAVVPGGWHNGVDGGG